MPLLHGWMSFIDHTNPPNVIGGQWFFMGRPLDKVRPCVITMESMTLDPHLPGRGIWATGVVQLLRWMCAHEDRNGAT